MAKYSKKIVDRICSLFEKDSYTIAEVCQEVGIAESTYHQWALDHSEFSESVKKAKDKFDAELIKEAKNSLRKLVCGFSVEEITTEFLPDKNGGKDENGKEKGRVKSQKRVKKHFAPNIAATIFFLTNKAPDEFQNKQNLDHTTKGKEIEQPAAPTIIIHGEIKEFPANENDIDQEKEAY